MTSMPRCTPSAETVSSRRLRDTVVTPSDCSMENATTRRYEWSLPIRVMSVPWSVVEHLPGEIRRRGVRYRIVRMDDVQAFFLGNAGDGVCQRQQVLRLAEQGVRRHLHLVEMQPGEAIAPSEGGLAADQMNAVAP